MTERYDVIVIGSGIGGLVAALTCARAGRSVLVLEAGKQFGGYTNPFARKRFHFDPGIHYIGECQPGGSFRRLLDRLGLEHVSFTELDPEGFDHYVFPDYEVKNCVGLDRFRDRLASDFPRETDGLDRFFRLLRDVDFTLKTSRRIDGPKSVVGLLGRAPGVLRWGRASLEECLEHHFDDPRLRAALAGPVGDLGLPPSRLSALMHLGLLCHYAGGAFFPSGGSGGLRDAFVGALKREGAVLKRNARVASILHEGGRVSAVRTADGVEYRSTQVISNAQASSTYAMVGLQDLSSRLQRKVERTEHSYASICIFLGVDGDLPTEHVGSSNIWNYSSTDIDAAFEDMSDFRHNGAYFLTVPTRKDPEGKLAPEGMQTVEMVTLCRHERYAPWFDGKTMKRGEDYEALKEDIADVYLERAEKHLPGLRDHIVLREVATPATNYSYTLSPNGNIYGPAHTVGQTMPFRFNVRTPIDGLYLCGASVISAGIVPCASSGRMAGKLALRDAKQPRVSTPARRWLREAMA